MLEFAILLDSYNLMIYRAGTAEGGGEGLVGLWPNYFFENYKEF